AAGARPDSGYCHAGGTPPADTHAARDFRRGGDRVRGGRPPAVASGDTQRFASTDLRPTMYEKFYGLTERPFDLTPNPKYLFLTASHREALSNLEYGIAARTGVTVLIGEAGTGKTTLIRAMLESR